MLRSKKKPATAAASPTSEATETNSGLPLFFKRPASLDSDRHAKAGLRQTIDFSFARKCNSIPLNTIEFIEAGHSYPIVFTNAEAPMPVAVLGWGEQNPFITDENGWREDNYIPAYVRQYPFVFYEAPDSNKMFLCIDEAAASYIESAGKEKGVMPLYMDGKPSETTNHALEFATAFYQHVKITRNFCDDLKKHNLLVPYNATVKLPDKEMRLNDFLVINEEALNKLPVETFMEFRDKGWLGFIYLALASTTHWKRLFHIAHGKTA